MEKTEIIQRLKELFLFYKTDNLKTLSSEEFKSYILSEVGQVDYESEGYTVNEIDKQRDLSVKFHWGHNHDFGDFSLTGRMGDRHFNILANFVTLFPISLEDFQNKEVFDIGCWTGGTSLMLAALGSKVFAIEEVKKYASMVNFLVNSFGLDDQLNVQPLSIYSCNSENFYDRFNIIFCPGVIYHLTDPLLALRIMFNALSLQGVILIESMGINADEPLCVFDGSYIHRSGEAAKLNRGGWNWFIPSQAALNRMLREAGFDEIITLFYKESGRVYGYGKKISQKGICKAGLSVPDIK